jgi:hypothetical protein
MRSDAAVLAALMLAGPAAAQDAASITAREARAALVELETYRDTAVFKLVGQPKAASFVSGDPSSKDGLAFDFTVDPKKAYSLVGFCGAACDGANMSARTTAGAVIGKDLGADDVATVAIAPGAAGAKLRAVVYPGACSRKAPDACVAAAALFEVLQ